MGENIITYSINRYKKIDNRQTEFKSCVYSNNLLSKLSSINKKFPGKIDLTKIKKAIYYAKKYHSTQKRLTGELYYLHPLAVTEMVADHCFKTDILVTSILHDTIEDTELTKNMIEDIFDTNIANNVEDLTRIKFGQKISAGKIVDLLRLQNKNDLLLIKYFDRLHNMQSVSFKLPQKILKIIDETLRKFIQLGIYLEKLFPGLLKINETLMNLCYEELLALSQNYRLNTSLYS